MPLAPDPPFPKSQGNSVRSKDWNDAVNEVIRLDNAKVNRNGDAITGGLSVSGNLGVGTTTPGARLDVKGAVILDAGGDASIFTGTGGSELNRSLLLRNSPGLQSASGLKAGGVLVSDDYGFASPAKTDLVVKGKVAIGTPAAGSSLQVNGGATVGTFAPFNAVGSLNVTGGGAEIGFVRRNLGSWPVSPAAGDRFIWYNPDGVARLWTHVTGDLLTVKSNGAVGVGMSDPQFRMDIVGRIRLHADPGGSAGLWLNGQGTSSIAATARAFIGLANDNSVGFWGNTGTPNWRLQVDTSTGNLFISGSTATKVGGATTWTISSDARLKQKIAPLDNALERLLQLRGATYEWKEPEKQGHETGQQIGFIGQQVEKVFPEWIRESADGYKQLSIRGFEALAVEALRELCAENQVLKQSLQQLRAQIATLAARSEATGEAP